MFKYLAALFMLIDHFAHIFSPMLSQETYLLCRAIGRLAFPMFAYALARGYNRTSNVFAYFMRLAIFAVLTQFLFIFATQQLSLPQYLFTNVLITFALAIAMLAAIDLIEKSSLDMMIMMKPALSEGEGEEQKVFNPGGIRLPAVVGTILGSILLILVIFITVTYNPDYSLYGLITVLIFQRIDRNEPAYERTMRTDLKRRRYLKLFGSFLLLNVIYTFGNIQSFGNSPDVWLQALSIFAVFFFPLYDRQVTRPGTFSKYFFYLFYPLHYTLLLVIYAIVR